ncbi:MAG: sulfatase-like hydrolase/transferase [Planctomycetota bacterium]|nr:sulfatase-like hydrolase/transferase [Planctomycetota bacterium]
MSHTSRQLNRREFLGAMAAGAAAGCLGQQAAAAETARPNVLVVMSDEHNAGVTGCYGNNLIRTPNLDGLAARGVAFESAYTNSPLCVPCRLSFTSGKYISRVGAWSNDCWLPGPDYPSLPRIMNAAGYESFLCGKMHYDSTCRYGFTEIGGNMNKGFMAGKGRRRQPDDLTPKGGLSARFQDFHTGHGSGMTHDTKVSDGATEFLSKRKRTDKPFFLFCGLITPHFPLIVPESYWQNYKDKVAMPELPPGHLDSLPLNYKHLRAGFNVVNVPPDTVKKGRELYYGLTQWMDECVGGILKALGKSDVADNTVVVYTTDHGENMGEHGLWWKNCMYEHAAHVPLIVSWPARWKGGQRRTAVCSHLDLVQTVAELGGAKVPPDWNGTSLSRWMDDANATWKDLAVSEYYAHNIASGYAMLRSGQLKYVYHTPADEKHPAQRELYDLKNDPGEFTNLAAKPEQQARIAELHAALIKELGEDPDVTERRCRADYAKGYDRKAGKRGKGGEE